MHQIAEFLHLAFRQEDAVYRVGRIAKAAFSGGFSFKKLFAVLTAVFEMFGCVLADRPLTPAGPPPELSGYDLVFCDEFDGDALDTEVWRYRGSGPRRGGFNGEEAVRVKDGSLILTASYLENGTYGEGWYAGAVALKKRYTRGHFEIRCKCSPGGEFWSAFWLQAEHPYDHDLSKGGPGGAEIDIFEAMGGAKRSRAEKNAVSQTIHCNGGDADRENIDSRVLGYFKGKNIFEEYNTYALQWTEDEYIFYINGVETVRSSFSLGVSETPEEVIVSLELPETITKDKDYTTDFIVDYVKIWQKADDRAGE